MSSSISRPMWTFATPSKPRRRQRPLDGDALRIEDARLRPDEYARAHGYAEPSEARATQSENGAPVISS